MATTITDFERIGKLDDPRVREASAFAASLRHPGIGWTVNDSGGKPAVYAIDLRTAKVVCEVIIKGATNYDFEAIACTRSTDGTPVVTVGDVGDNSKARSNVRFFQITEPKELKNQTVDPRHPVFKLTYPGGKRYDSESMFGEPGPKGRLYVVTKERAPGTCRIYRTPYASSGVMEFVGNTGREWLTDTALSPDGKLLIARSDDYGMAWSWPGLGKRAEFKWPDQIQGEGLTFSADGKDIYLNGEGVDWLIRVPVSALPL